MSMLQWVREEKSPNLILFVHGLQGGIETWKYDDETSFPSLLANDKEISETHDIACFDYFTYISTTYGAAKSWYSKLFKTSKKAKKNLPIQEIAELLNTEIKINLNEYSNIVIVAHSMGGLVTKSCILKQIEEEQFTTVKGIISLAVPHSGAKIANIGGLVSKNIQVKELGVLSDTVDELSRGWLHTPNKPRTEYIYASYDQYVDKKSALAIESNKKHTRAVEEDHSSICKPKDNNQTIYKAVKKYIISFDEKYTGILDIEDYIDNNQFDDEYFVIKLIIADVHETITGHAKEYFFNAELARKVFTSDHDKEKLSALYKKIKHIYQEEYDIHIANKTTSDMLTSSVHSRIMAEDQNYLKSLLPDIDNIHKKGMLHQLANKRDKTIVWSSLTKLSDIDEKKIL